VNQMERETFVLYPSFLLVPHFSTPVVLEYQGGGYKEGHLSFTWHLGTYLVCLLPGTSSFLQVKYERGPGTISLLDLLTGKVTELGAIPFPSHFKYSCVEPGIPGVIHLVVEKGASLQVYEVTTTELTLLQTFEAGKFVEVLGKGVVTGVEYDDKSKRSIATIWRYVERKGQSLTGDTKCYQSATGGTQCYQKFQMKFPAGLRVRRLRETEGGVVLVCDDENYVFDLKTFSLFSVLDTRNVISTTCILTEDPSDTFLTEKLFNEWNQSYRLPGNYEVISPYELKARCLLTREGNDLVLWFLGPGGYTPTFQVPNLGSNRLSKYFLLPPSKEQRERRLRQLMEILSVPKDLLEEVVGFCSC